MPYFKTPNSDSPHWLDELDDPEQWLPEGSTPITDAEAEAMRVAALPVPTVVEQLEILDADNALTQRNLRQIIMRMAEGLKQATGGQFDMTTVPGVAKAIEVESKAAQLRSQL
ncbi:hypothetical protein P26218_25 [Rhodoferax phage P26218]|uniref:hypothetical protein n=1 Tax=Rhodoferax phage P26218 TaxID=1636270 RepID=UPI0005FEB744|nr:hypothetical protein AXJ08_gp25 [Rhodoferax phage P26218]AKA60328.1 hypothetical protein P26218_25 [Rhodoferax phage P26218]